MLKLRQYFCRHNFKLKVKHRHTNQTLSICKKCGVYKTSHDGLILEFKHKSLENTIWDCQEEN